MSTATRHAVNRSRTPRNIGCGPLWREVLKGVFEPLYTMLLALEYLDGPPIDVS